MTTRDGVRRVAMPSALTARLNGHRITREFRTGLGTLTSASLGADAGARFGRNRLVVRAADGHGRVDREVHHFRIRRIRPLAGAGPARRIKVGTARTVPDSGARVGSARWRRPRGARCSSLHLTS